MQTKNPVTRIKKPIKLVEGGSQLISVAGSISIGALKTVELSSRLPKAQIPTILPPIEFTTLGLSAFGFVAGTVIDAIRLWELWNKQGQYAKLSQSVADQTLENLTALWVNSQFKQIKTTAYILKNRLLFLAFLVLQSLAYAGVITLAGPGAITVIAIGVAFHISKSIFSYIRIAKEYRVNQDELSHLLATNSNAERILLLQERQAILKYKAVNTSIKLSMILVMTATVGAISLFAGPLAPLIIPAALLVLFGLLALYQAVIKPKIKQYFIANAHEKNQETPANKAESEQLLETGEHVQKLSFARPHLFWLNNDDSVSKNNHEPSRSDDFSHVK